MHTVVLRELHRMVLHDFRGRTRLLSIFAWILNAIEDYLACFRMITMAVEDYCRVCMDTEYHELFTYHFYE